MVKYDDFEKTRLEIRTAEKNKLRKMFKYEDFEKALLEICTAEIKREKWSNMGILKRPGLKYALRRKKLEKWSDIKILKRPG